MMFSVSESGPDDKLSSRVMRNFFICTLNLIFPWTFVLLLFFPVI